MREIKFRAWNEKDGYEFWDSLICASYSMPDVFCQNRILEQFTGLCDKTGKDIYEGDILVKWERDYEFELTDENPDWPLIQTKKDTATMERFPSFWLENESFGYEGEDLESPIEWEIIGNIHQNPELLA